jgi:hypothetical protein
LHSIETANKQSSSLGMSCEVRACSTAAAPVELQQPAEGAASAQPPPAAATSYRAVLGRAAWLLMHEMSSNLQSAAHLPLFYQTVRSIVKLYPCAVCRDNAVRLLQLPEFADPQPLPGDDEEARRAARSYVNRLHAAVTVSVAARGGYVSARSAELARAYLPTGMPNL